MSTYSSGLFPFIQNASLHVKTAFLNLLEEHYLPLGPALVPCISGLLTALLPCIEDEASSDPVTHARIVRILKTV